MPYNGFDVDKLHQIYTTLQQGGYEEDYDTFKGGFCGRDNYENRLQVYTLLHDNGADIGDSYEEFIDLMEYKPAGQQAQQPAAQRQQPQPQPAAQPKQQRKSKRQRGWSSPRQMAAAGYFANKAVEIRNDFNARKQRVRNVRKNSPITPEGRRNRRARRMQARMAGAPVNAGPINSEFAGGIGSPQVADVKYDRNGKGRTVWALPDGTETDSNFTAGLYEISARQDRLAHEFDKRMIENGWDPKDQAKRQEQAFLDAAETRALPEEQQKELDGYMTQMGLDPQDKQHIRWAVLGDTDSIAEYRLAQAEGRLQELEARKGEEIDRENSKGTWLERLGRNVSRGTSYTHPTPDGPEGKKPLGRELEMATAEVAGLSRALNEKRRLTRAADSGWYNNLWQGVYDAVRDPNNWSMGIWNASVNNTAANYANDKGASARNLMASYMISKNLEAQTPNPGGVYQGSRFVGDMMSDPFIVGSFGAGHFVGKGITSSLGKATGKAVARKLEGKVAEDVALRYFTNTAAGRFATKYGARALEGGANFFTFETLGDMRQQFVDGGWYDDGFTDEKGVYHEPQFHEGFSVGHALKRGGHGFLTGTAMGLFGAGVGNVTERAMGKVYSGAAKTGVKMAGAGVSVVGEGTIFAAPDIINFHTMDDKEFDAKYAEKFGYQGLSGEKRAEAREAARDSVSWDAWTESMAFVAGMKITGVANPGSMGQRVRLFKDVKYVLDGLRKDDRRDHRSFGERWRMMYEKRNVFGQHLTKDDLEEMRQAGYGDLLGLLSGDEVKKPKAKAGDKAVEPYVERAEAEEVGGAMGGSLDGYSEMQKFMEDGRVSEACRAKVYNILTGHLLPPSTITGYRTEEGEDGSVTVLALNAHGDVVTRTKCKNQKDAERETASLDRQVELNTIDIGEKYAAEAVNLVLMDEVKEGVARKWNLPEEAVEGIYMRRMRGEELRGSEAEIASDVDAMAKGLEGKYKTLTPDAIREKVSEDYGIDVDEALRKTPDKRTEDEREVVREYGERLFRESERQRQAREMWEREKDNIREENHEEFKRAWRMQMEGRLLFGRMKESGSPEEQDAAADDVAAAVERMHAAEAAIEDAFEESPEEWMARIQEDAWGALSEPGLTEDQKAAVLEYINARSVLEGVMDASEEAVQDAARQEEARMERFVHRKKGVIEPATMKVDDERVYVIDGDVAMLADGSGVDVRNSSESVVILGADGEYRFTSPDRILRVEGEQDAEAAKRAAAEAAAAEAAEAIRQMLEQAGIDASHLIPREMPSRNGTFYMRGKRDGNGRVFTMPENLPPRVRQRLIEGRRSGGIIPGNARLGSMQDVAGGGLAGSLPAEGVMGRFTPGEEPVEPETALSRIPYRDGEPDFTAVDAETGWEGLVEAMEGERNAREIAEQMAKDTAKDLEALENKRPKPVKPRLSGKKSPMAMREEQKRAEQANREAQERYDAELEEARRKAAAWGAILRVPQQREAELRKAEEEREAREAAEAAERKALARINKEYGEVYDEVKGCEAAVERLHSTEPEDIMEAASVVLSSHKILWGDEGTRRGMKSETGYGEGERRKMFGMFASRENGGVSLRRLAEDPMKEVCGAHGIAYDSREAMDALLDVLQAAAVPTDIRKYIERRRMAQALELKRQEDAYLREQYEEWCREMYHLSADEYEAYEEYMSEALKNLDENFDEKEYFDNIADEISNIEKNGYREIQEDASEREGRGNGGSGEVLSAERSVQGGRDATDAGQSGLSERDGIQGDGAERPVLEGTSGRSEVIPGFDGGAAAAEGAGGQGLRPAGAGAEQADAAAAGDGAGENGAGAVDAPKKGAAIIDPRSMTEEDRNKRRDSLLEGEAVNVVKGTITSQDGKSARKTAEEWWDLNVGKSVSFDTEAGVVEIDKTSVKDSLSHGYSQGKLDAITSLANGFNNAVYLGSLEDFNRPGVKNHYFAYPIIYDGERRYVFCRAMSDNNKNRLYVHEVFMAEGIKESDTLQTIASASNDGELHGGIALYKAILNNILGVSGGKGNTLSADKQADGGKSSEPYTITPTTYTNKRGKTSDVHFVKFGRELTAGEKDAAYDYIDEPLEDGKKTKRGWYDRKRGGYMMRSEEAARGLGELIGGGEADSEGAGVADVADVAEVNAAQRAVRDMLVAKGLMREGERLDLIVNSSNDMEDGAAITGLQAKVVRKRMEQALGKDNPTYQDIHDAVTNTVSRAKVNVNGLSFLYEMLDKFNSGEVTAGEFMDVVESMFHLDKRGQAMPEHQAWVRRMAASGRGASSGSEGADKPDGSDGPGGAPVLERDDFKPAGKRRRGGKKPKGAVNRVDVESLMEELSGTGEASLADHSEPVVTEDKPKGGFKVTDEMRKQEEELRRLLGIGDDEGDRGERFRDPDSMTPAEKRMVFRLGVDYAFNFLDNGITGFEDFAKAVTGRLGSKVKPFVKSWYEGAKRVPGYGGEGYTPTEEVDRFDIENFDKPGSDVFREAEMRAAEYKAKKAAEQAEREMIEEKRKRIEEDKRRAGGIFGEAERVAREAREKRKKAVQEAAGEITGGKGMKNGEKDVTLKPETAVGDLFAGLYDEGPKEDKRDEGRGSRPGEGVAGGERTHSVGADAPGADGGLPAGGTEPSDGGRESAEGSGDVERGAGDAAHGPDAERGVRPPVGNRGRDEGGTDSGSADAAVERGGTSGRGSEPERGADGGAEGVSEGEPAAVAGGGSGPASVKKPKKPAARYTGNFRYDESGNEADSYTPSQRLEANVKAVETLADVLFGGKPATEEQKLIMSRFRGWGQVDLGKYYDVDHILRNTYADTPIHRLGEVIKRLDPDGEKKLFEAIKRASLSSYYTPTPVARAMNTFVALSGYRGGSLLDPSMGNGMFEGTLPKSIQERTAITGVELDWLSGQLSRALYPDANVMIGSFENSGITPGSFDVVTSNVPFGDIAVYDPTWKNDASPLKRSAQNRIHNYYAVKMLEATRPGGIMAMMTTSAVMDTPSNQNIRAHIADQGEILGAIRLPDNTFQGTGVVTDIIFVRKWRDEQDREQTRAEESYMKTERAFLSQEEATAPNKLDGSAQKVKYNGYYKLNRRNLIGEIRAGNQYGKKDAFGLTSNLDVDEIGAEVEKAVKRIVGTRRGSLFNPTRTVREVQQAVREAYKGDGDWVSNGNLVVQDGKVGTLTTKKNEYGEETRTFEGTLKHDKMLPRIKSMIGLRTAMKKLVAAQIEGERDETLSALRSELQKAYDDFTGKYGSLQDKGNAFILDDIDGYTLQALEVWKNGKFEGLSDIFTKNSIKPSIRLDGKKRPQEAVAISLAEYGYLRPDYLSKALGEDWAEQCGDVVFLKPGSEDDYVTRDEYLSGDVVTKLAEARAAAENDKSFERNVKALEDVQPTRIPFDDVAIHLGARWIPEEILNDFVNELLGIQARYSSRNSVWDPERRMYVNKQKSGVRYLPETDSFIINLDKKELGGAASDWETPKKSAKDILQAALEDKTLVITYKDKEGNVHVDEEQTELANQKIADLRERFETWLPSDPARVDLLEQAYNDRFNRTVIRHFDGSHLVVPGLMGKELRPHQKDAVWMLINNRGGIVDHIVGAGKTLVMQSAIMEMRRMGIAKKPMIVALKSTVSQIAREFKEAFPSARVLAPDDNDFKKKNRKKFIANISLNDYDCVILSHEQYCMLPHTEEAERVVVDEQLQQLDNIIEYLYGTEDQSQLTKKQIKALEKRRENLKARLEKRLDRAVDREFCFENLGVDYLFVDESHQFKALPYVTSYQRVAGLGSPEGSNRAVALLTGIRYLQRLHQGDKGTVFLSGTTITNSLVEVYNLLNYLRPRKLEELGMSTFDAWASTFAVHSSELEATVTGGFALKDRFRQFDNVAELSQLYAEIADVRNDQNLKLPKPGVDSRTVIVPASDAMSEINAEIVNMIESKNGSYFGIYPQDPNREPWGLHASTLSAKAAVSPKLIFPDADDGGGKVHAVCENVKKYYDEMSEQRGVQLIFCEMGVPGKGKEYDAYTDMVNRFVNDYGIPRSEIAYIQEANTEEKRKKLFQRVRDGKVRILIGGTKNMGTGVNVQDRITDAHMLTVPWTPSALEQCIGRAARQGNVVARDFMGNKVRVHYYATEGSLDLYKYQLLDAKGKMISQFKTGTTGGTRSFDEGSADEDGNMDPAEMVAILSGNPVIFEKAKQEKLVKKLRALRNGFERDYQRKKAKYEELRMRKGNLERLIRMNGRDREDLERNGFKPDDKGIYPATVTVNDTGSYYGGRRFDKPKEAGEYLLAALDKGKDVTLSGFGQRAKVATVNEDKGNSLFSYRELRIGEGDERSIRYSVRLSDDATAAGTAFRNLLKRIVDNGEVYRRKLEEIESQLSGMNIGDGVFPKQGEYDAAVAKLKELTAEYNKLGKKSGSGDGNDGSKTRYRLVEDGEALRELDGGPLKKGYRYVQWAEGGIRPPMTGKVDGKWRAPMLLNRWEQSEEGMQGAGGKVNLVQGNGRTTGGVAYNPYFHIRTNPLNDQFTAAFDRPELMVVEGYYPESEERSGYRAEGAKDSVGLMDWHSGSVNGQLSGETKVKTMLSRYFKPTRIVPWSEVADMIVERIAGQDITFPLNVVPPMLRAELARRSVRFEGISGSVSAEDRLRLEAIGEEIERGNYDAGLERAKEYQAAYETSEDGMRMRAEELSERLNTPIQLVGSREDADKLPTRRKRRAKGYYEPGKGIVVVLPNHANVADVENTVLHEVVGHDGMRVLFPSEEKLNNALDELYNASEDRIRADIDARTQRMVDAEAERLFREKQEGYETVEDANGNFYGDKAEAYTEANAKREEYRREATEEYGADLAGKIGEEGFEKMSREELTFWGKLKGKLQRALENLLRGLKIPKMRKWRDREWAYVLHKAYKAKKNGGKMDVFEAAEDAAMRARAGIDEPMGRQLPGKRARIEKLRRSEPVVVDEKLIPENVDLNNRKDVQNYLKANVRGDYTNESDGTKIALTWRGLNEVTHHGMTEPAHVKSLFAIPEMLKKSIYIDSRRNLKGHNGFEEYKYYVCGLVIDGEDYTAKIVIGVKNGQSYYDHRLSKIEKGKLINSLNNFSNEVAENKLPETGYKGTTLESLLQISDEEKEKTTRFRDGDMGLDEYVTKIKVEAAKASGDNLAARHDAMKAIGGNLNKLRQAMARQREYDATTVRSVTDLARMFMDEGLLDDLSKMEMKRILGSVNRVVGRQDTAKEVQKVLDIMVDNQLRLSAKAFGSLLKVKGSKVNAAGVEVQGELDVRGQQIVQVLKKGIKMQLPEIEAQIDDALDRMGSDDAAVAEAADIELDGLLTAKWYVQEIKGSKTEEQALRDSIKEAKEEKDKGNMTEAAYRQYVAATEDAIRQNKIERAEQYAEIVERLGMKLGDSTERAKAWRAAEKARVDEIHHNANSDMEGRAADEHHKPTRTQKALNSDAARFLLAPLATFDQMLRMLGRKNARGEGYLWNRFMRGWEDATEKEYLGYRQALKELDAKVKEIWGKKRMKWSALFRLDRKLPTMKVKFMDGGEMKEHVLTQGNLLYIYMVDKMSDGRMKLRKMGITEDDIEAIKNTLDPKFMELGDWLQEEYLVGKRNKYNEVHRRMFGASMAAIENYFPLKVLKNARTEDVDVATDTGDATAIPATTTGSIIKRRRNNLALDITGANALTVILDHLQEMEKWAAFSEFNRDLNTLLSYKRFRNQVMNMTSAYGAGAQLWETFKDVCKMAAGSYRPPVSKLNKTAVNFAKGVTAAKVSFRIYTALKQLLSLPAYLSDTNPVYLAANVANPIGAWRWCMKNLPLFHKRWFSRMAGDPRLLKTEMDWKMWRSRAVQIASRLGMSPNAFVDAVTVAIGAHAMYQTKLAKYKRYGYTPEEAERRARQDATILFNQTQQSSESAFLSTMQVDHDWISTLFTVFRNSAMSYTRQEFDAFRNIGHKLTPGYKRRTEEFMAKQMERDGIEAEQAAKNAKREYRNSWMRDLTRLAIFGFGLQLLWNLGSYLPYMIFGDDDEKKKEFWDDSVNHAIYGSVEGLTGGDVMSNVLNTVSKGDTVTAWNATKEMPLSADLEKIWDRFNKDHAWAWNDVINILVQSGLGVNPQSFEDAVVAVMEYCGDDAQTQRECALLICGILNCPPSQQDAIYFDEIELSARDASKLTPAQIAERYARYKTRKNTVLTGWLQSDEEREKMMEKYRGQVNARQKEAFGRATDARVSSRNMQRYMQEWKQIKAEADEIAKVKSEDEDRYYELRDQLESKDAYDRYLVVNRYKKQVSALTKKWLRSKSVAERDSISREIVNLKREMDAELKIAQ